MKGNNNMENEDLGRNVMEVAGNGTEIDPFIISNVEGFNGIRDNLAGYYRLAGDIDFLGKTITPIGTKATPFTGELDGNGRVIKNFKISTSTYAGLFGYIKYANIKNLSLEHGETMATGDYAGALVGYSYGGIIIGCYAAGNVIGNRYVGGLVGYAESNSKIQDSYAVGSVSSTNMTGSYAANTGGLVGFSYGVSIKNCFASCKVSKKGKGLLFNYSDTSVENSYFDSQVAEFGTTDKYNQGKLTSALLRKDFFKNWDFDTVWDIQEGTTYPYHRSRGIVEPVVDSGEILGGVGTEKSPYLIGTANGISNITYELSGYYKLATDIDLDGEIITPIGTYEIPFTGELDGDGHVIKNFMISMSTYAGLFGYIKYANIKNLGLEKVETKDTTDYVGALVGYSYGGIITECYAAGTVIGNRYVGGLVGYAESNSKIQDSYAVGSVSSTNITDSYAANTGGLVGFSYGVSIKNCFSLCRVSKNGRGLVYHYNDTRVENSYFDSLVTEFGSNDKYNQGKLTSALLRKEFFKNWDFETVWDIQEGVTYPYHRRRGIVGYTADPKIIVEGAGIEELPYLIGTASGINIIPYELSGSYKLTTDIDLNGEIITPIGTNIAPFIGELDGDGHAIKNFKVSTNTYAGLFGYIKYANIKNLGLENGEIKAVTTYAGALAGYSYGGTIIGCYATGTVIGNRYVGGLVGYAELNSKIQDSYAVGSVLSTNTNDSYAANTGGLVGLSYDVSIKNCYASCKVSKNGKGLVYHYSRTRVEDSYFDILVAGFGTADTYNQGKLTSAFLRKDFFKNWDFDTVWDIKEGITYPYHKRRGLSGPIVDSGAISTGAGIEDLPYIIETASGISNITYELGSFYKLSANIDLKEEIITPIGTKETPFTGELDGDGYAIKNFKISTSMYAGLFGYIKEAKLKNLGLENVEIKATSYYAGTLVGYSYGGTISGCYAAGNVVGNRYVGGLVGNAESNSKIQNSYAVGNVSSTGTSDSDTVYTGGLVGGSYRASIKNCYASCKVSKNGKGLLHNYGYTTVEDSYFDSLATGFGTTDTYNQGKLTSALLRKNFFKNWDFETVWDIKEGTTYPYHRGREIAESVIDPGVISQGAGIEELPYLIETSSGINIIPYELGGSYKLITDIDLNGETKTPIGTFETPFTGELDGGGYAIKNFKISTSMYAGLFGYIKEAKLKDLGLENVEIKATSYYAGTLVGYSYGGTISGCYAAGNVVGNRYVGGLVGYAESYSKIQNSYAVGNVSSTGMSDSDTVYTGGLVGGSYRASIKNCYASCKVSKNGKGLLHNYGYSTVEDSYFDSLATGFGTTDTYNQGKLTSALLRKNFFKNWDFETVWDIKEGTTYPYHRGRGIAESVVDPGVISQGAGIEELPYLIETSSGINIIPYELGGSYKLTTDIDLNGETKTSIGTFETPFTGVLDGDGYAIKNFKISTSMYAGLFGYIKEAKLKNLGLENVEIKATSYYAGTLVGYSYGGTISGCYVTGNVVGNRYVGGLVGYAESNSKIQNSCAVGNVSSTGTSDSDTVYTGGLVGGSYRTSIKNCYTSCKVSKNGKGLAYIGTGTTVEDSYFDSLITGFGTSDTCNQGKLTSALLRKSFFKNWDFEMVWDIQEGTTYPYHRSRGIVGAPTVKPKIIVEGAGIEELPYLIGTASGISIIPYELGGFYKLATDIDLNGKTIIPIGKYETPFIGELDGDGHEIRDFKISTDVYAGLFGYVKLGKLKNFKLINGEIKATSNYAGALAGYLDSCTVENIGLVDITVLGNAYTSGLTGCSDGGNLIGCFGKNISVSGTNRVGGLIGIANYGVKVDECCIEGNVKGNSYVGGLIGQAYAMICNSYVTGSVTSNSNSSYTGGLIGDASSSSSIVKSYAACQISQNGKGLSGSGTVSTSYFDSVLTGFITPSSQARTTEQMLNMETYEGWDGINFWSYREGLYPKLKKVEAINYEPFELSFCKRTSHSVVLEWPIIIGANEYDISYQNKLVNSLIPKALIENLNPDTDYDFSVQAKIGNTIKIWSKLLKIRTKKVPEIVGIHSTNKTEDSITFTWNPVEDAESYEVRYNNKVQVSDTNTCTIIGLETDKPYAIYIKTCYSDGSSFTSNPIVEKIHTLAPQTDYATVFIEKCEGQTWFIDEIENLINQKGKTINTIQSKEDFAAIYAIGLADRGISGKLPIAIGELSSLEYLYLGNNNLSGEIPEELQLLEKIVEMDLSGNQFSQL